MDDPYPVCVLKFLPVNTFYATRNTIVTRNNGTFRTEAMNKVASKNRVMKKRGLNLTRG